MNKSRFRCVALLALILFTSDGASWTIRPLKDIQIVGDSHGGVLLFTGYRCDRIANGVVSIDICRLPVPARLFSSGGATFAVTTKGLSRFSIRNGCEFSDVFIRPQLNYGGAFGNNILLIDQAAHVIICWSAKDAVVKLRRELERVRQQRDILKKTLGILSEPPSNASSGSTR